MRTCLLGLALGLLASASAAQEPDLKKRIAEQKKAGEEAWKVVEAGPGAFAETKHLLIFAPKSMGGRLKAVGATLERYHDLASKVLSFDPKVPAYEGKLTVYLLPDRMMLGDFARRVEKRRPMGEGPGSFAAEDDRLHAAAVPAAAGKNAPPPEALAGEQVAALLLQRRAGVRTPVPDWLLAGFGRATSYRALPRERFVLEDRKLARALAGKRKPADVWGGALGAEEAPAMQGSVAELLAFGSSARFPKFVEGFRPPENAESATTAQALEAAKISPEAVEKAWKKWAVTPR